MKNTILGILAVLGLLVLGFVGYVSTQPSHLHVERTKSIAAMPTDIWPYISDFEHFPAWSPWHGLDPNQTVAVSDPSGGVGAWYTWQGNDKVGKGKMTYTTVEEPSQVTESLEFIEPFQATATVTIALAPEGTSTKATWGYDEDQGFMGKAFGVFMDMDQMLGADFQKGLDQMATLAEADAKARMEKETLAAEAAVGAEGAPATGEDAEATAAAAPPTP